MNTLFKVALACLVILSTISYSCKKKIADLVNPGATLKTYYVSALTGLNANDGLSATAPFKSISKAADNTNPGDVVLIMNGVYNSMSGSVLNISRSGTSDKYITYKAFTGHTSKITASANVWNAVVINASYIVFDGVELEGNNANLT